MWRERDSKGGFLLNKSVGDAYLTATEWMEFMASTMGIKIQHMFNGKKFLLYILHVCLDVLSAIDMLMQ